jgi:hypothetical protein
MKKKIFLIAKNCKKLRFLQRFSFKEREKKDIFILRKSVIKLHKKGINNLENEN